MAFRDYLAMLRPTNSAMVGFAVMVGIAVTGQSLLLSYPALLGFLTGFFISAYSMVVNDLHDIDADRINVPLRPLPDGRVSRKGASFYAVTLLTLGIATSMVTSPTNLAIASLFAFVSWLYNRWGKKRGLPGNAMVALSISIPYIYGGFIVGRGDDPLLFLLALTSFLAAMGREVIKTIPDVRGDRVRRVKSIALTRGGAFASRVGASFFISAIAISVLPIITGIVGLAYSLLVTLPIAIFIYASYRIVLDHSREGALRVKKLALVGMLLGLVAFIGGGIVRG